MPERDSPDAAPQTGQRLDEVEPGDRQAMGQDRRPNTSIRGGLWNIGLQPELQASHDCGEQQGSRHVEERQRPRRLNYCGAAGAGERGHPGDLPLPRVRHIGDRMRVGTVNRRKAGAAERPGIDAGGSQGTHEWQGAVDVASPIDLAADELVRLLAGQPVFPLAIPDLLAPVGARRRAMSVPDERGRGEANLPPLGLNPPTHVHVVAGTHEHWIEPADREQGLPPKRAVTARDVLGDPIVQQDMRGCPRRAGDALREPRVVRRDDCGTACGNDLRC